VNHVSLDYAGSMDAYRRLLGGVAFRTWEIPEQGTTNALVTVGDACIELFGASDHEKPLGRWAVRRGLGAWHSLEWTIPSQAEADDILRDWGIRVTDRVDGAYTFTHPRDCHGICLELTEHHFPDDPRDDVAVHPQPGWFRDDQPLGITGLAGIRVLSTDASASADWLAELTGTERGAERELPRAGGRGVAVDLPGHTIEFVQPVGAGELADAAAEGGPRILSVAFGVVDLAAATTHLHDQATSTLAGLEEGSIRLDPVATHGAVVELVARPSAG
jgi:hypothetical protein